MESFIKEALDIVKAQAGVRVMTEEEIHSMVVKIAASIKSITEGEEVAVAEAEEVGDARKSIKERTIRCLECGKEGKLLTKKHLATHGLTNAEYCEKWGLKKGTKLVCKALQRARRKKMTDMKLWEKRRKVAK